jgi:hypothetical protein
MERVTRGRVKKVQVRLQRRGGACCAVLRACRGTVPVLACAVCLTLDAANGGFF